jgi:hypothetical protein
MLLCQEITYPLLFLLRTSGVGGEEIFVTPTPLPQNHLPAAVPTWTSGEVVKRSVPLPLLCQEITYPLLFLRGTSGLGGEEICATTTPLPGNHLPAAVPARNLWCRR